MRVNQDEIVGGTGIINNLSPGSNFTWNDLMMLMVVVSDNTATNLIIDLLGIDHINSFFQKTGLKNTTLERKMFDIDAIKLGKNNYTTAKDMGFLLALLARGEYFDSRVANSVLNVMIRQICATKLPALIPALPYYEAGPFSMNVPDGRVIVANKTGELPGIQHDIGVFKLPNGQRYVIAMLTSDLIDSQEGVVAIAKVSSIVYKSFC